MAADAPKFRTLIDGPEGRIRLWEGVWELEVAAELFDALKGSVAWQREWVRMFGKVYEVPRRVAWYGDPGVSYRYAGVDHEPLPWFTTLLAVRSKVEALAGTSFNSVLLNQYRTGRDHMGWHRDNEPELGSQPVIASVSFGVARRFDLRHTETKERVSCVLEPGSVCIMDGPLQAHWHHRMPPAPREEGMRINLTYRQVLNRRTS